MLEAVRFAERLFHFPQNVEHVAAVETGSLRVRGLGLTTCRQIAEQKEATEHNRRECYPLYALSPCRLLAGRRCFVPDRCQGFRCRVRWQSDGGGRGGA